MKRARHMQNATESFDESNHLLSAEEGVLNSHDCTGGTSVLV